MTGLDPLRTLLTGANITPDKGTGIGNYSDQDFSRRRSAWNTPGWRAPLSGDAVYFLYIHDRCGRLGDQGLSLQSRSGARSQSLKHADLPVQSAVVDSLLVAVVQCKQP